MTRPITRTMEWGARGYSMVIDVRAPYEFADDHIPSAVNLPVLNDDERARVGTMHKQVGAFEARRLGAGLVAANIARHVAQNLCDAPRDFAPLVYCWRGGQRSRAMAQVLSEIGWKVSVLDGGYKTYRKQMLDGLDALPATIRIVVVRGRTGTAKTRVLRAAANMGAQIIDLEGLARHRGSLLGPEPDAAQPTQRLFESELHGAIAGLDLKRPVFVEAESNKIGELHIPRAMWRAMQGARALTIEAPLSARVEFLVDDYAHVIAEPGRLDPLMEWIKGRIGHETRDAWLASIAAGDWRGFVGQVLEGHYDPAYDRSSSRRAFEDVGRLEAERLDDANIKAMATRLARMD